MEQTSDQVNLTNHLRMCECVFSHLIGICSTHKLISGPWPAGIYAVRDWREI